jgi:hypothetical protein
MSQHAMALNANGSHEALCDGLRLMIPPRAIAALERQAEREEVMLVDLAERILERAASLVVVEESIRSIERGAFCICDRYAQALDMGFDVGAGDA